jgi:hypothetical protein
MHFKILSWYSIEDALPFRVPAQHGETRIGKESGSHRGQEIYIPLMTPGLGPPCSVHRMVTSLHC